MKVCKQVIYAGQVQGVGFRYMAQGLAAGFAVTGYVRNLPNREVELVAEGAAEEVDAFLQAVAARMADFIQQTRVKDVAPGNYRRFEIRH